MRPRVRAAAAALGLVMLAISPSACARGAGGDDRTEVGSPPDGAPAANAHVPSSGASGQAAASSRLQGGDTTPTVYKREVFTYPGGENRRDPFAPLNAGQDIGPRFDDLELNGIIYSPEIGSVAVLVDRATRKRYRVHEEDWLGDARVESIQSDSVVFTVTGFGASRREVLRMNRGTQE